MVQRNNKLSIIYWQGEKTPSLVLNILEYETQRVIFLKEAELVLSYFSLCLKVLLKLWSSFRGEKFTEKSDCRF